MGFMNWRVVALEGMPDGYELRYACQHNQSIFVVGDQGYIYQYNLYDILEHIREKSVAVE